MVKVGKFTEPIHAMGGVVEGWYSRDYHWVEVKNASKYAIVSGAEIIVRGRKYMVLRTEYSLAANTVRAYLGDPPPPPPADWDQ